jgi:prolyl oligopeptidase
LLRLWLADTYIPSCRETIAASEAPNGAAAYAFDVRLFTTTELTPKEVHEIGLGEVARILIEMDRVIARTDWYAADPARAQLPPEERRAAFIAYLRTSPRFYCTKAEDLLGRYRDICKRIDALLPEYFGKLPRLPYGVREIPRFMAPQQTTAYYMPGSMKAGLPGWFYANTFALDQRPTYEIVPLSLHEAVPGHHLQIAISQELEGLPEFRQDVESTAFIEGWALYAERLGTPMGLYEDPYDDFGRLLYEMWRSCRLVVDTGMHSLGMSRADAIAYMTRHTALSPLNIEREVDRYISWPGQALAYKIGELRIRAIRAECEATLGDGFDLRAFHDHLLWAGPLPLDVLELRMRDWAQSRAAR